MLASNVNRMAFRILNMTIADRIALRLEELKMTPAELARRIGVSKATVSHWLNGTTGLKGENLTKAAAVLECSPTWLQTGRSSRRDDAPEDAPSDKDYALIPQYTALGECGNGYLNDHAEIKGGLAFKRDWLAKMKVKPENLCVIYASGASMEPYVMEGDVVLFDQSDITPRDRQVYAIRRPDGDISIKRLVLGLTGSWIIRSDNPNKSDYPDEALSADAVHEMPIIGRVIWRGGGMM